MVTILIPSSISENRIPVLPPCFLRGIKAPPPPLSHLALRERGWDNGERRHYIKTNETANQTNMQNRHLYFFFAQKNSVSSRENGFECTDQNCCSRIWMGYDKK